MTGTVFQFCTVAHLEYPAGRTATDLASWRLFETENPSTFRAMYQFWVQKEG